MFVAGVPDRIRARIAVVPGRRDGAPQACSRLISEILAIGFRNDAAAGAREDEVLNSRTRLFFKPRVSRAGQKGGRSSPPPIRSVLFRSVLLWVMVGARVGRARVATATVTLVIIVGASLVCFMAGIGEASCQRSRQREETERCSQEAHSVLLFGCVENETRRATGGSRCGRRP
jgi:hypothetical protein